ncbi:MAG: exodeoxyribonuclease III [Alphaproteobacteria bacterium]|nr:exodeoxyribonuclease III [Alphaproteobacteria bacterium]
MRIKIASWNVNSVRLRLPLVERLIEEAAPDVLCLQETKVVDALFPRDFFRDKGYAQTVIRGQKGYHGVAILSRLPLADPGGREWAARDDRRHASAILPGGVTLHNFYVPAGGDVPDPETNPSFAHKLAFLDEMADWFARPQADAGPAILVGDLNVAPLETDVWSHRQLLKVVSHTPEEVERLNRVRASAGWVDAVRRFIPESERLYSWWSYRARDWAGSDRGRRLDHIWVTAPLEKRLVSAEILKVARGWERPSDHAPVVAVFDWPSTA